MKEAVEDSFPECVPRKIGPQRQYTKGFQWLSEPAKLCVSTPCRLQMHISKLEDLKIPVLKEALLDSRVQSI